MAKLEAYVNQYNVMQSHHDEFVGEHKEKVESFKFWEVEFKKALKELELAKKNKDSDYWIKALKLRVRDMHERMDYLHLHRVQMERNFGNLKTKVETLMKKPNTKKYVKKKAMLPLFKADKYRVPKFPKIAEKTRYVHPATPPAPKSRVEFQKDLQAATKDEIMKRNEWVKVVGVLGKLSEERKEIERKIAAFGENLALQNELEVKKKELSELVEVVDEVAKKFTEATTLVEDIQNNLIFYYKVQFVERNSQSAIAPGNSVQTPAPFELSSLKQDETVNFEGMTVESPPKANRTIILQSPTVLPKQQRARSATTHREPHRQQLTQKRRTFPLQPPSEHPESHSTRHRSKTAPSSPQNQTRVIRVSPQKPPTEIEKLQNIKKALERKIELQKEALEQSYDSDNILADFYSFELQEMEKKYEKVKSKLDKLGVETSGSSGVTRRSPVESKRESFDKEKIQKNLQEIAELNEIQNFWRDHFEASLKDVFDDNGEAMFVERDQNFMLEAIDVYQKVVQLNEEMLRWVVDNREEFSEEEVQTAVDALTEIESLKINKTPMQQQGKTTVKSPVEAYNLSGLKNDKTVFFDAPTHLSPQNVDRIFNLQPPSQNSIHHSTPYRSLTPNAALSQARVNRTYEVFPQNSPSEIEKLQLKLRQIENDLIKKKALHAKAKKRVNQADKMCLNFWIKELKENETQVNHAEKDYEAVKSKILKLQMKTSMRGSSAKSNDGSFNKEDVIKLLLEVKIFASTRDSWRDHFKNVLSEVVVGNDEDEALEIDRGFWLDAIEVYLKIVRDGEKMLRWVMANRGEFSPEDVKIAVDALSELDSVKRSISPKRQRQVIPSPSFQIRRMKPKASVEKVNVTKRNLDFQ